MLASRKLSVGAGVTLFFVVGSFLSRVETRAVQADGVFISEIQVAGAVGGKADVGDEFIELYNSSDEAVNLEGWMLRRRTASGSEYNLLKDIGGTIPSGGYLLIAPRDEDCAAGGCYHGQAVPDRRYSNKEFLAADNGLFLYEDGVIVDSVGWGNAGEGYLKRYADQVPAGKSIARLVTQGAIGDFHLEDAPSPGGAGSAANLQEPIAISHPIAKEEGMDDGTEAGVPKVVISEFLPDPAGKDTEDEFVELHNMGASEADIGGWSLEDVAGKTASFVFVAGTRIPSGGYQAFYSEDTKLSLNNTGDGAVLKDEDGVVVNRTPLSGAAEEGAAFVPEEGGDWVWTSAPTPGSANVIRRPAGREDADRAADGSDPAPAGASEATEATEPEGEVPVAYDYSDLVVINEVFPDPAGRDNQAGNWEWVELYNRSTREVRLAGWSLDDVRDKGSKPYRFEDEVIPAGGYLAVSSEISRLSLNNSDEEVNLLWPDGRVEDTVSYGKSEEDESYSLNAAGGWSWTKTKTPGAKNRAPAALAGDIVGENNSFQDDAGDAIGAEDGTAELLSAKDGLGAYAETTITQAKLLPLGSRVFLTGIVSAPTLVLGKDYFYLQEEGTGAGLRIFSYVGSLPELGLGDEVLVRGFMSSAGAERRLVLSDEGGVEKLASDRLLDIAPIAVAEAGEDDLGKLARLEGTVAEVADDRLFFIEDSGSRLKVYAEPESGVSFDGLRAGARVAVTGIVSRTSLGLRLLPRFQSDLRFEKPADDAIMGTISTAAPAVGLRPELGILLLFCFLLLFDRVRLGRKLRGKAASDISS